MCLPTLSMQKYTTHRSIKEHIIRTSMVQTYFEATLINSHLVHAKTKKCIAKKQDEQKHVPPVKMWTTWKLPGHSMNNDHQKKTTIERTSTHKKTIERTFPKKCICDWTPPSLSLTCDELWNMSWHLKMDQQRMIKPSHKKVLGTCIKTNYYTTRYN